MTSAASPQFRSVQGTHPDALMQVLLIDKSKGMESVVKWITILVNRLDSSLKKEGIGAGTTKNMFCVVEFGGGYETVEHFKERLVSHVRSPKNELCVTATGIRDVMASIDFGKIWFVDKTGNNRSEEAHLEDGYLAFEFALTAFKDLLYNYSREANMAGNVLLLTDEDRDELSRSLSRSGIKKLFRTSGFSLDVVVDHQFRYVFLNGSWYNALGGVHGSKMSAYLPNDTNGACAAIDDHGGKVTPFKAYRKTNRDYTSVAQELQGSSWNIELLEKLADPTCFTDSFVKFRTSSIAALNCQVCNCKDGKESCLADSDQARCHCASNGPLYKVRLKFPHSERTEHTLSLPLPLSPCLSPPPPPPPPSHFFLSFSLG